MQQNAAAAEQAEVEAGGSSSSTVGAAGCADKRRTRSSDAPEVIEEPPKKKKKGLQKGKVGKGKLTYAQRKKISDVCKGKEKLTLEQKTEIIKLHKSYKVPASKVAQQFGVNERTVRKICNPAYQAKLFEASNSGVDAANIKSIRPEEYPELTKKLLEWIENMRNKFNHDKDFGFGTSLEMIKKKAREFAREFIENSDEKYEKFTATNGWASRWVKRYSVSSVGLVGEAADVDPNDPAVVEQMAGIRELLKDVKMENVYNMDETGLYHRALPNRMYITPGENLNRRKLRGKKALKAKDRVSLLVAVNVLGNRRVPLVAIGEAKQPEVFKHLGWPDKRYVRYTHQENSWNCKEICQWWFDEVFVPFARARAGKGEKIVLLWDNCSAHRIRNVHRDVEIQFLPKETTAVHQPLDGGIISSLKARYKKAMMEQISFIVDEWEAVRKRMQWCKRGCAGLSVGSQHT